MKTSFCSVECFMWYIMCISGFQKALNISFANEFQRLIQNEHYIGWPWTVPLLYCIWHLLICGDNSRIAMEPKEIQGSRISFNLKAATVTSLQPCPFVQWTFGFPSGFPCAREMRRKYEHVSFTKDEWSICVLLGCGVPDVDRSTLRTWLWFVSSDILLNISG